MIEKVTYTAITLVSLVNHALPHWGGVDGVAGALVELLDLLLDAVPDRARIDEDECIVLCLLYELDDLIKYELLNLGVVRRRLDVEWCLETLGGDALVGNIGGEHQVYRAGLKIRVSTCRIQRCESALP